MCVCGVCVCVCVHVFVSIAEPQLHSSSMPGIYGLQPMCYTCDPCHSYSIVPVQLLTISLICDALTLSFCHAICPYYETLDF